MNQISNVVVFLALLFFMACNKDVPQESKTSTAPSVEIKIVKPPVTSQSTSQSYSWLPNYDVSSAIINRIPLPEGYKRILPKDDFSDWLRHIPLQAAGAPVRYYSGGIKTREVHAAVLDIDIGDRDLQQCADAVMRLWAEYHYTKKQFDQIHFNFTSGDMVSFDDWRFGKRPLVKGNIVAFTPKTESADNSYPNFKKYMYKIFNYAGTASLEKELVRVKVEDIRPGDVFIQGGFPGHAVLVMDVAEHSETKKRIFMLAQSYMPAQSIHILKNPADGALSPWYDTNFGTTLETPEWLFKREDLRRFPEK